MADVVDKATRSRMMSGIRAKNTRTEVFVRKGLHALGFRYRLHRNDIPGKPDIVLPKYRALILIHGCFWHGHNCHYFHLPRTNTEFWRSKIEANRHRDKRNLLAQRLAGWRSLVVWECAIRSSMKRSATINVIDLAAKWIRISDTNATIDVGGMRTRSK